MTIHHEKAHEGVVLNPCDIEDFKVIEAIDVGISLAKSSGDWVGQPSEEHNGQYLASRSIGAVARRAIEQGVEDPGMTLEAQKLPLEDRIRLAEIYRASLFICEEELEPVVDSLVVAAEVASHRPDLEIAKVYSLDAARQALEKSETQFVAAA